MATKPQNLPKFWSMGGTMGEYTRYIIMSITVCCHTHKQNSLSQHILHRVQNEDMFDGTSNLMRKSEK